jgi:hypothetical protein
MCHKKVWAMLKNRRKEKISMPKEHEKKYQRA